MRTTVLALALALAAPAAAGEFRVVVRGVVTQLNGVMPAPYQLTTPGSPMVLTLEAYDFPVVIIPGTSQRYLVNETRSTLELGVAAAPLYVGGLAQSFVVDDDLLPPNIPGPFDALTFSLAIDAGAAGILPLMTSIVDATAQALPSVDAAALARARYSTAWPSSSAAGDLLLFNCRVRVERVEFVPDSVGLAYCPATSANAAGRYGRLEISGSRRLADSDLTLHASGLPPHAAGYFLVGQSQGQHTLTGLSAGTLCLDNPLGRLVGPGEVYAGNAAGTATLTLDLARLPTPNGFVAATVGETWSFQSWYRQSLPAPNNSHFTGAASVTLE